MKIQKYVQFYKNTKIQILQNDKYMMQSWPVHRDAGATGGIRDQGTVYWPYASKLLFGKCDFSQIIKSNLNIPWVVKRPLES